MFQTKEIEQLLATKITTIQADAYNEDYDAFTFTTSTATYKHRSAKITPTKQGGFVVMWEKNVDNTNMPFAYSDFPDFLIVSINETQHAGYFIFPKKVLQDKNILSVQNKGGKMGFRVYPDWSRDLNKTAQKSKDWQIIYFKQTPIPTNEKESQQHAENN